MRPFWTSERTCLAYAWVALLSMHTLSAGCADSLAGPGSARGAVAVAGGGIDARAAAGAGGEGGMDARAAAVAGGGVDARAAAGAGGSMDASAAAGAGGSMDASAAAGAPFAGASGSPTRKLSFAADVFDAVILTHCGSCHNDAPSFGGLAYFPGGAAFAYGNLVGVPAGKGETYLCRDSGLMRVSPGDPEHSLLYLKLTMPPCGHKMPPADFGEVATEKVALVRQWIMDGANP